ncbi:hypothetical protein HNQ69_001602 [Bartonella callosciuri]|uniref:Uncharacterized protein n=1 Tax=Bartonella callosciuri TaxID=686223 RepID=A0A840NYY3_9HYPH|nr:hypothetical protein [Bartonella callosciuri]MBB5074459.1 hypothetical protein [Bartonella callosciuri]
MSIDKPQHESFQAQSESVFVLQAMLEKRFKLLSFKKAMLFSKKDNLIIFCISFIALVFFVAVISLKPLEFFHVVSKWQLQAMAQESFHGMFLDNLKNLVLGQFSLGGKHMEELWRAVG